MAGEEEESTSALSDEDEFGDLVNEMEKGILRKKRQGSTYKKRFLYDEVPPELMLLPQERQILATARTKVESTRLLMQKRRCYRTTCALFGVIIVFAGALMVWRSFSLWA